MNIRKKYLIFYYTNALPVPVTFFPYQDSFCNDLWILVTFKIRVMTYGTPSSVAPYHILPFFTGGLIPVYHLH